MDLQPVVIADALGVIRFWSPGAEAAFGHSAPRAVGQPLELIIPPDHHAAHRAGFLRAMASGRAAAEGQPGPFPVVLAGGVVAETNGRLTLMRDSAGRGVGAVVVFD